MIQNSGLRQRKGAIRAVTELDAFPKVPESYQETTATGGGVTILVFVFIAILVISEVNYYSSSDLKFDYVIDPDHHGKLKINVDITVAMKCHHIGADILDLTGQNAQSFGSLDEHPVHFELSPDQKKYAAMMNILHSYVKGSYHSIHDFLWKTGFLGVNSGLPPREDKPTTPPDACRLNGTLVVNKVAGNFHVTAGKGVPFFGGQHAHLTSGLEKKDYNFSHRIDLFSFGEPTPGILNPLDGELKVTTKTHHLFQYFIQVVPTDVHTKEAQINTCQFSVTEKNRSIDHSQGSHGVPGIYVKYDLSPLKISVKEEYKPFWQFLVRLCGIVGGIFATSGMLHSLVSFLMDVACCRFKIGKYGKRSHSEVFTDTSSTPPPPLSSAPMSSLTQTSPSLTSPQSLVTESTQPHIDNSYTTQQLLSSDNNTPGVTLLPQDNPVS